MSDIDALESDYVLKASATELEAYYVAKGQVTPLILDSANYFISDQKGAQLDVTHDFRRGAFGRERIIVKGTVLDIAIPYTGDAVLWRLRGSTYGSAYPEIEIGDDVVIFNCRFPDDSPDPQKLKTEIEGHVTALSNGVGYLSGDVANHNRQLVEEIRTAIQRKLKKASEAVGAVASLGIPIRKRAEPLSFTTPAARRPSPVSRPKVAEEKFEREPALDEAEFVHILKVLKSMSLVMERSPDAFASLDEEAIRTHFILQLNGHYEGSATGETFNSDGKTDILIRVADKNVFIAECKFWRGPKSFDEAIDQLLGYLSWRDSKCALVIFNKNKDSSAIGAKMHELMLARKECRKTIHQNLNGDCRYVLVKASDPGREINLCTMLFDIPKP